MNKHSASVWDHCSIFMHWVIFLLIYVLKTASDIFYNCNFKEKLLIYILNKINVFLYFFHCGMWNSVVDPWSLFSGKSSHTQPHNLHVLSCQNKTPSFHCALLETSHHSPQPLTPTILFFLPRRILRRNVFQHIRPRAPKSLPQTCPLWFSQRINCSK